MCFGMVECVVAVHSLSLSLYVCVCEYWVAYGIYRKGKRGRVRERQTNKVLHMMCFFFVFSFIKSLLFLQVISLLCPHRLVSVVLPVLAVSLQLMNRCAASSSLFPLPCDCLVDCTFISSLPLTPFHLSPSHHSSSSSPSVSCCH